MNASHPAAPSVRPQRPTWRRAAEVTLPAVAVAVVAVAPLLVWSRLPDPMAVHWGLTGTPDGAAPRLVDLLLLTLAAALLGFGPLVAARARMPRWSARVLVGTAAGGSALLATLRIVTLQANLDAATWDAAAPLGLRDLALALVVTAIATLLGAALAGDRPDDAPTTHAPTATTIRPGEAVVWTGRAANPAGTLAPLALLVAAAVAAWLAPPEARTVLLIVLPVVAVALTTLAQVTVTIGPRGLVARLGWFGWPRIRVPVETITDVEVEQVEPVSYGGWGLRVVPGATGLVVRRGPGLRIGRRGASTLVVTVGDAERAAGILLAHLERAAGPAERT